MVPCKVDRIERRECPRRRDPGEAHLSVAVLIVALVRTEEEELVLDERAAGTETGDVSGVIRLRKTWCLSLAEGILRYQVLVLVAERCVACPDIPTRSRRGDDDRARRLLVFGFEVLSDDAILLDGIARERIAAARVLTECSTVNPSTPAAAAIVTASSCTAERPSLKSSGNTSAIKTRTWAFCAAIPICRAVTSYSPGARPTMV